MRWLILALSLGTTLATLWHGIMFFITNLGTARTASSSPFWWGVALCVASLFGFIGGVLAFNHRMISLVFLLAATVMAFFGYPESYALYAAFAAISILALIYLMMQRRSSMRMGHYEFDDDYPDDEEENDDDEYEDDQEQEPEPEPAPSKYKKIPKRRSSYFTSQRPDSLTIKSPQRQRETKVCLSCGIDVPISFKYCPSCGTELHTPPETKSDAMLEDIAGEAAQTEEDEAFKIQGAETGTAKYNIKRRARHDIDEDGEENKSKDDDIEINDDSINDKLEDIEVVPVVRKTPPPEETDESREIDDVPFKPVSAPAKKHYKIESDASYQSFGRYTQSRKRRKVSILQRALLAFVILCLIGGVVLLMYRGIYQSAPPDNIETPVPRVISEDRDDTANVPANNTSDDLPVLAVPGPFGALPYMEVSPPAKVVIIGTSVNLRQNHTTASNRVTSIQANNTYDLLEQWKTDNASALPASDRNQNLTGTWFRIQAGSNAGWVYGQYAMALDGRSTSLPAGYTDALLNSFGSNREEIEAKLGAPRQSSGGDPVILEYTNLRITLRQNKVQNIQITGGNNSLINGLAGGITFDEMTQIIGFPNTYRGRDRTLTYLEAANRGIAIQRENNGNIRSINVGNL